MTTQSLESRFGQLRRTYSVDIYFGPKPPTGKESNWIYTAPGRGWFCGFRLYDPDKPFFDKSWKLPDIEQGEAVKAKVAA